MSLTNNTTVGTEKPKRKVKGLGEIPVLTEKEKEKQSKEFNLDMRLFDFQNVLGEHFFKKHGVGFHKLKEGYDITIPQKLDDKTKELIPEQKGHYPGSDELFAYYHILTEHLQKSRQKIKRATKLKNKQKLMIMYMNDQQQMDFIRDRMLRTTYLYKRAIEIYSKLEYKEELVKNLLAYMILI